MFRRYRFGRFELDGEAGELLRDGELLQLQDLPLRLLVALVKEAPGVVSREDLRDALWPPGTYLDVDASLNTAVARVREALGDDASSPRFVATVPRKGYRFVAPVERLKEARSVPWPAFAAVGLALAALGLWWAILASDAGLAGGGREVPASGLTAGAGDSPRERAREYLLIGRHQADRRSREGLEKAIAAFQSAAALAPESAEAYSGLASSYALLGIYDFWRPREAFGPAETLAHRALELDPESAEAHLAMGLVAAVARWDWERSAAEVDRAVELAPSSAEAWLWRGALLSSLGRHDEALESTRRALALDPTSPVVNSALSWQLFQARRGEEAVAHSHHTIELHPDYYDAWDNLKWIEITLGRDRGRDGGRDGGHEAAALEAWVRAEELDDRGDGDGSGVRRVYERGGLAALHRESIKGQIERWESGRYQPPYDVVLEYAALGEVEEALTWLERSFAERETDLVSLAVDPRLDALRGHPRFQELLGRMGFPAPVSPP